jgi:hypothetical protein
MHFNARLFAIDKKMPTMKGLRGEIKPAYRLSDIDVQEIRKLYNCSSKSTKVTTTTTGIKTTVVVGPASRQVDYLVLEKTQFLNHYKLFANIKSIDECWKYCEQEKATCASVTLGTSDGLCHLYTKEKTRPILNQECCTSATWKEDYKILEKVQFVNHYKRFDNIASVDVCWRHCQVEKATCAGVTLDSVGFCHLYTQENINPTENREGYMSAIWKVDYLVLEKTQFVNHYKRVDGIGSINECWIHCEQDRGTCAGTTHRNSSCLLYKKDDIIPISNKQCCTSAIRSCY